MQFVANEDASSNGSHSCIGDFATKLAHFFFEVLAEAVELHLEVRAGLLHSIFRLHISIGLDANLDAFLKRMGLLVASEAHSIIFEELVADDVAQGVVLLLDQDGGSILASRVVDTLDKIPWLLLNDSSIGICSTAHAGSSCHLIA